MMNEQQNTTEKQKPTREELMQRLFAPVTNISRAQRLAKALLGPLARVWNRDGEFQVGEQHLDGTKVLYGAGVTLSAAFMDATSDLGPERIEELAYPELRALFSLDSRQAAARLREVDA
jgi:hypothetical protein